MREQELYDRISAMGISKGDKVTNRERKNANYWLYGIISGEKPLIILDYAFYDRRSKKWREDKVYFNAQAFFENFYKSENQTF